MPRSHDRDGGVKAQVPLVIQNSYDRNPVLLFCVPPFKIACGEGAGSQAHGQSWNRLKVL